MKIGPPVGPVLTLFRSRQLWSERSARSLSLFLGKAKRRAVRLLKKYMTLLLNPLYISSIRKLFMHFRQQNCFLLSFLSVLFIVSCVLNCSVLRLIQFSLVTQSCPTRVRLIATPMNCTRQASLSCTISQNLLFPCDSAGKESSCSLGDLGSIPGLRRSLEKGKGMHCSIVAWRIPWTV